MLACGCKALHCRFALWQMALGISKRRLYWAGLALGCAPVRCRWCEWAASAMHYEWLSATSPDAFVDIATAFFPKTYIYESECAAGGSSHCVGKRANGPICGSPTAGGSMVGQCVHHQGPPGVASFHPSPKKVCIRSVCLRGGHRRDPNAFRWPTCFVLEMWCLLLLLLLLSHSLTPRQGPAQPPAVQMASWPSPTAGRSRAAQTVERRHR